MQSTLTIMHSQTTAYLQWNYIMYVYDILYFIVGVYQSVYALIFIFIELILLPGARPRARRRSRWNFAKYYTNI